MPLLKLHPFLNEGTFVFCTLRDSTAIPPSDHLMSFKETEGTTVILKKELADLHQLGYSYEASWITLQVQTSLSMIGLTAEFSTALAEQGISCNVVAACYHDHVFVDVKNARKAMEVLERMEIKCL